MIDNRISCSLRSSVLGGFYGLFSSELLYLLFPYLSCTDKIFLLSIDLRKINMIVCLLNVTDAFTACELRKVRLLLGWGRREMVGDTRKY